MGPNNFAKSSASAFGSTQRLCTFDSVGRERTQRTGHILRVANQKMDTLTPSRTDGGMARSI